MPASALTAFTDALPLFSEVRAKKIFDALVALYPFTSLTAESNGIVDPHRQDGITGPA